MGSTYLARSGFIPCSAPVGAGGKMCDPGDQTLSSAPRDPRTVEQKQTWSDKAEDGRCRPAEKLSFGELEPLAGSLLSILFALFAACIAGKEAFSLELLAQFNVE